MSIRLVVGLGNPEPRHQQTRHNVGFGVVVRMVSDEVQWKKWKQLGLYVELPGSKGIYLVQPLTYMNLSGQMVADFAKFYKINPQEILVCYDDFAFPLGDVRMHPKGSSGGHNGMQSIIDALGTQEIPRLRIGIGPLPKGVDPAVFVLKKTSREENSDLAHAALRAGEAVRAAIEDGLEKAMNDCNAPRVPDAGKE